MSSTGSDGGATGAGGTGSGASTGGGTASGSTGTGTALPCPGDGPIDPKEGTWPFDPVCNLWVSSSIGDDANPGTEQQPVRTIAHAIELAKKGPRHIYACGEVYAEAVELPAGISLFGGFYDCKTTGPWSHAAANHPAIIAPGKPGAVALTLTPNDDRSFAGARSWVGDLTAQSADAVEPGGSSIAVLALEGARATFRRHSFIAGKGADGADGDPGDHGGEPAAKGLSGNKGADACTLAVGAGGTPVETQCDGGAISKSGEGGDGGEGFANDGHKGDPEPMPNPQGDGLGGLGESSAQGNPCTGGKAGAQGVKGAEGFWPSSPGHLTASGYAGMSGGDGESGTPGQGGGGGGASSGRASCGAAPHGGAGGGSGGSGGCGGKGGKGGQAGGSSIAFACLSTDVSLEAGTYTAGNGGKGGNGGAGQAGGQGGVPGIGGAGLGAADPIKKGCAGGAGGYGGDGGNGGGGHGGHSVCVTYRANTQPAKSGNLTCNQGAFGTGGHSGDPFAPIPLFVNGIAGIELALDP
jgi:hypothetical protein